MARDVSVYRGVGGENMNENMSNEFSEQSCAVLKMMETEGLWVQFPEFHHILGRYSASSLRFAMFAGYHLC